MTRQTTLAGRPRAKLTGVLCSSGSANRCGARVAPYRVELDKPRQSRQPGIHCIMQAICSMQASLMISTPTAHLLPACNPLCPFFFITDLSQPPSARSARFTCSLLYSTPAELICSAHFVPSSLPWLQSHVLLPLSTTQPARAYSSAILSNLAPLQRLERRCLQVVRPFPQSYNALDHLTLSSCICILFPPPFVCSCCLADD